MADTTPHKRTKALDRFEVLGELGEGAASKILHIRDPETQQHYAMKLVIRRTAEEQKYLDQAKHEYEIAQKFDHPCLVKIHDIRVIRRWFRQREVRTLLEYVNGQTLEQFHCAAVPLLVLIFTEVAGAVSYMHRHDVFHADLKPNNIMVSHSGQVKVIDFGLAWLRGEHKHRVQGTVGYLAPEQMRDRVVTEATEVFNFGATLYRTLTGRAASPAPGAVPAKFIAAQGLVTPAHEVNTEVPRSLSDLVSRCCETKPQKRPAHMTDVHRSLEEIRQAMGIAPDSLPGLLRAASRPARGERPPHHR